MQVFKILFLIVSMMLFRSFAFADDLDDIEAELEKKAPAYQLEAPPEAAPAASADPNAPPPTTAQQFEKEEKEISATSKDQDKVTFSGLGKLAPFSEIAVLQRRYLPHTGRFELNGNLTTVTNDPFFTASGYVVRFGYNFTEALGIEANYINVSTSPRQATKSLANRGVRTSSLVTPKSFLGLDLKWSPSYGKMTYLNKSIVPFDLYFALGMGTTTTSENEGASTVHVATGQTFAFSKSFAFRWDFSWNFYAANARVETGVGTQVFEVKRQNFNNLFLSLGLSWFFPEAGYR